MASVPATTKPKAPIQTGGRLAAFVPTTFDEAWRVANVLANSGMAPNAYDRNPDKAMVAMMAGAEVGLTPFAALQSIAVIGNNPALWGDGALALVHASGLLEDMEEKDDGNTATCTLVRKGRKSPIVGSFSMDDAKKAGLAGKSGPWSQYPARMRKMRARAFAMRDGFADVLKGLHIAEEVRDYAPADGGEISNTPAALTGDMLLEQSRPTETVVEVEAVEETHPAAATVEAMRELLDVAKTKAQVDDIARKYGADVEAMPDDLATEAKSLVTSTRARIAAELAADATQENA